MSKFRLSNLFIFLVIIWNSAGLGAGDEISIKRGGRVYGEYSRSANVRLSIIIERHKDNRSIEVECESENFFRGSRIDIDGESQIQFILEFNLSSGTYECRAALSRSNGDRFYDKERFFIP